jgi:hypothetical protein
MPFDVRTMTRMELDLALQWAVAEGWNPGLYDAEAFHRFYPQGFFIGEMDGEPVGSISAVPYTDEFGFLGLYIMLPKFRGQGYSVDLWDMAMLHLGGRNIGLACPTAQESYYEECDFKTAYRSTRFEVIGGGSKPRGGVVALGEVPLDEVVDYDARVFAAPRGKFLEAWISQPESVALGVVSKGRLTGYGVLRRCHVGYKIGPLMADTQRGAEMLLRALLAAKPGESIFIDMPEINPAAVALGERQHLRPVLETAWMYTQGLPPLATKKLYGMTTRGLG